MEPWEIEPRAQVNGPNGDCDRCLAFRELCRRETGQNNHIGRVDVVSSLSLCNGSVDTCR